jgi:PPM family protein phosphatase
MAVMTMEDISPVTVVSDPKPHTIYANEDMQSYGEMHQLENGTAVVYVNRLPDKPTENEDSAGVYILNVTDCALAVADGMGGMPCGAQASRLVVEQLQGSLKGISPSEFGYREAMLNGIDAANNAITALSVGAGSTLAAIEIFNNILRPYHVGDSMILVVGQRGKVKLQTISHSPVGYAVESGMLDEHEALHHDDRHVISNYLGHPEMRIEIGPPLALSQYDTVLVASDGLFDNLQLPEIVELIRKGKLSKISEELVALCNKRMRHEDPDHPSKPDDVSFILFRRN